MISDAADDRTRNRVEIEQVQVGARRGIHDDV